MNYRNSHKKRINKKSKYTIPSLKGTCHKPTMPFYNQICNGLINWCFKIPAYAYCHPVTTTGTYFLKLFKRIVTTQQVYLIDYQ